MANRRRTLRLKDYDYSRPGAYFLTFVLRDRRRLFGEILDGEMRLSAPGNMVQSVWLHLGDRYPGIQLDEFVIMPDHFHGIVHFTEGESKAVPRLDLFQLVHRFKSLTTAKYRHGVATLGWPRFRGRLWQRDYYEHVVRGREELDRIRRYIRLNPLL
jgi:REP element-mobilizing transposase RayT